MINNFRSEMESKIKEKEREQEQEKVEKVQEKKEEQELDAVEAVTERVVAFETVETESTPAKEVVSGDIKVEVHATAVHHDQVLEPKMAHAMSHEISHSQAVSGANKFTRTSSPTNFNSLRGSFACQEKLLSLT